MADFERNADGYDVAEKWNMDGDGNITVQRQQFVADHVDYCKARANEGLHGLPDFKLKASIPVTVVEAYCRINGITLQEFMTNREHTRRIVNDPNFADLRIAPGRM